MTTPLSKAPADLRRYIKSLDVMPSELRGLECEDPISCGATGDDVSLCPPCHQREQWLENRRRLDTDAAAQAAADRIAWDQAKANAIFAERQRLAPALQDLRVLAAIYPEELREILVGPTLDIVLAAASKGVST